MVITFLWILCVALILLGLAGTVLPVLPGTVLVWGGIVLGAWIDDFARVGMTTVVVVSVLALLAWGLEYVAGLMGAKKAGASKLALMGAAVGTVINVFIPDMVVFGGAMANAGELIFEPVRREARAHSFA